LLCLGTDKKDDIQKTQLVRQVNGLNLFFALVAPSTALLVWFYIPHSAFLVTVQICAAVAYVFCIWLTSRGYVQSVRNITIYVFELQMFSAIMLTNVSASGVLFVVIIYPLLAALFEVSRFQHMTISFVQVIAVYVLHIFFPGIERRIMSFYSLDASATTIMTIMCLFVIPLISTVVIDLFFRENMLARKKLKALVSEITVSNRKLEIYAERLRDESLRLQEEVNIARKIQTMVLPSVDEIDKIELLEISCMMMTADEVGGDYYDVIPLDDTVTIGIGDVTGHGLSSGIIMMMAQTVIRTLAEMRVSDPSILMNVVNRVLYANIHRIREDRNMTLALITYRDRRFVVTGQHESVIILRKDGRNEIVDTMDLGFYVGLMPDISDKIGQLDIALESGDLMILYSDGITEAENPAGVQFGQELIVSTMRKYTGLPTQKIVSKFMKDLCNYMGDSIIQDDISLVVIRQK
jgi:serine phosphatase RsbU (regulator of sigma subunit)